MLTIAHHLRTIDKTHDYHRKAWINRTAENINKNDTFTDFFDLEKQELIYWYGDKELEQKRMMKELIFNANR